MQEARKGTPAKVIKPETDVQAVLDLPDSPKDQYERERQEKFMAIDANSKETRQMIEDIRARQERDKQILLLDHNKRVNNMKVE